MSGCGGDDMTSLIELDAIPVSLQPAEILTKSASFVLLQPHNFLGKMKQAMRLSRTMGSQLFLTNQDRQEMTADERT